MCYSLQVHNAGHFGDGLNLRADTEESKVIQSGSNQQVVDNQTRNMDYGTRILKSIQMRKTDHRAQAQQ
jgi:hypothetical protein